MKYPKTFKYSSRKKALDAYRDKVLCVISLRCKTKKSFQVIADECKISDRSDAYKIYHANRLDPEFK